MNEALWDFKNHYEWMKKTECESFPPMIISCSVTPEFQGKERNKNIPETMNEQIEAACSAYQEGASIVHIHARDPKDYSKAATDQEIYSEINQEIRKRCPDIIISNSTRGSIGYSLEQKLCCLDAEYKPDLADLNTGIMQLDMNTLERNAPLTNPKPAENVDVNIMTTYKEIRGIANTMKERDIKAEIEIFQPGHFWVMRDLLKHSLVQKPYVCQLTLGYQSYSYATPHNLLSILREIPSDSILFVSGIGNYQLPMNTLSMILGGHVRVGMGDALFYRSNEPAESNSQLVARIRRIAVEMNRTIATPGQARKMLGMN